LGSSLTFVLTQGFVGRHHRRRVSRAFGMSVVGQTRKYSYRAYVFRFTPQSRHPGQYAVQHLADIAVRLWATRPIVIANVIGTKDKAGLN